VNLKLALILAAIALDFAAGVYFERLVRVHHEDKVTIANQQQEIKRTTDDTKITSEEGKTYAAAVAKALSEPDPAPAVVCVRRYTLQVAAPAAARLAHDGGGGLPQGTPRPLEPTTDIGNPAVLIGARANAQVAALKDYITRVCLAH
jgi:hypothetical protein